MQQSMGIYCALVVLEMLCIITGTITLYIGAIRAANKFHHRMLLRVLRCPLSFFDTTPIGRVLNRFSQDITTIDQEVTANLLMLLQQWTWVPVVYGLITFNSVYLAIVLGFVTLVFYLLYVSVRKFINQCLIGFLFCYSRNCTSARQINLSA